MNLIPLIVLALTTAGICAAEPVHTKAAEPLRISHGETVELTDYLVPGKTTIFDFSSQYCPPCRAYEEPLAKLHAKRDDVAIVKVDINRPDVKRIDWQSPVARQYDLHSIPHFKVFGPDGKLRAEDKVVIKDHKLDEAASSEAAREIVDALIKESAG